MKKFIAVVICFIVVAVAMVEIVPTGYTGVKTTFGQVNDEPAKSGFSVVVPFAQSIHNVNNKRQETTFDDIVWGETSEQTVVYCTGVTVSYRINPEYSVWIYQNIANYKENALPDTLVQSALKNAMVSLTSREVTKRSVIEPEAVQTIQQALNEKYGAEIVTVYAVNIQQMDFEDAYNKAIEQKSLAQMDAERQALVNAQEIANKEAEAEKSRIEAQAEADKKLISAGAEADSIRMKSAAEAEAIAKKAKAEAEANIVIAESITDKLIEYKKIEQWDGKYPSVYGAGAPLISSVEELF